MKKSELREIVREVIRKVGDEYAVYPKKGGKRLGTHKTRKGAEDQMTAIHISKYSENLDPSYKHDGKAAPHGSGYKKATQEGKYDDMSKFNLVKKNPFDIKKLVQKGIIHVTAPGDGKGGIGEPNWEGDASILTLYNLDRAEPWMRKAIKLPAPKAIPHVQDNQEDLFYNGKYNQILWSIEKKGLKPEDFYLKVKEGTVQADLAGDKINELKCKYGQYFCPHDKVYKCRKSPKKTRSEDVHKPMNPGILKKRLGKLSCSKVRKERQGLKDKGTTYAKALQRYLNYHCQ